jgi:hypothetical protein
MTKQPEARKTDQPLALSSSAVLGHDGGEARQSMNTEEAFKAIQRQAPCPHDSTDTSLGNGKVWAKCYDCGVTFPQDGLMRARDAAQRFDDAVAHLRALVTCVA